jgi:hypothetical protein
VSRDILVEFDVHDAILGERVHRARLGLSLSRNRNGSGIGA